MYTFAVFFFVLNLVENMIFYTDYILYQQFRYLAIRFVFGLRLLAFSGLVASFDLVFLHQTATRPPENTTKSNAK
jgi:hypothetical protein